MASQYRKAAHQEITFTIIIEENNKKYVYYIDEKEDIMEWNEERILILIEKFHKINSSSSISIIRGMGT